MLLTLTFLLIVLSAVNYRIGRSIFYPPFAFTSVWAAACLMLVVVGDMYYAISFSTALIYLLGSLAFSCGGAMALVPKMRPFHFGERETSERARRIVHRILDWELAAAVLFVPVYVRYLRLMSDISPVSGNFWVRVRRGTMLVNNLPGGGTPFHWEVLVVPLFCIFAVIAVYEYEGGTYRRWRTYGAVAIGVAYEVMSGARSELLLLLGALLAVGYVKTGGYHLKALTVCGLLFFVIFLGVQIQMGKTGTDPNAPLSYNLPVAAEGAVDYFVGGLVAFDYSVEHPGFIKNQWTLDKFFRRTANKVGGHYEESSRHLEFVDIGPGRESNVYTIYFAFLDYGYIGIVLFMGLLGACTVTAYRFALRGRPLAVILFSVSLFACYMSIFGEEFFSQTGFWVKTLIVIVALYHVIPWCARQYSFRSLEAA